MNLATSSDNTPQRTNRDSVTDTHEAGLIDNLHSPASTR